MALLEDLTTVAVVGAGAMGTGIAQVAAQAGHQVHLVDAEPGGAAAAHQRLGDSLSRLVGKGKMTADERAGVLERIVIGPAADGDLAQLPPVGLAIEAVIEDLAVKQEIFETLADHQDESTVLATNTSSLDVGALSHDLATPERLIGLHFFNPPPLMRLVEVVRTTQSDPEILEQASTLMERWGKTPVLCTSTPGFIVNRVARPFYGEAQRMIEAGTADPATIDLALREHGGFRMGPCELTDLIGQDVNFAVGRSVWLQTGRDPRYEPADVQRRLVEAGRLGRKSGRGWFEYDDSGEPIDATPDEGQVAELVGGPIETDPVARTLAMLVNEGVDLVRRDEATAEDVDTAMKLGTNYPKGPHEWLAEIGAATIVEQLRALDAAFPGGRYRVSSALEDQL
ncbi:3-hydroxyacyl-CoA dehydrogenase NAD-binding domain-containing protein [Ornithinimicrobium cryptoxanthini]|uniref:3-hydroxyacyl-CoA dehydrogenase NAD-binding domain-containing protein n=1 Tax=Ornithinimicrobium cryptoxanthini TaxID=2934161 RepID=A0ABY4YIC6_9MICO|nr:3-hydroxyacyl-CoA dehydrogenase NAD-binding domain-containing protein [Ornithinimicrobium cryptoxanthini]USQ76509.1 3-hydroxyacyl-CoA dehydrogenase NAD-binding domain-containing protein [Ornithinimicrobium cryptoxanthini]